MITNPIRVALVEDVPELRRSLVEALSSAPDLCMVGVWGTAEAALEAAPVVAPAVLLMDIHLPGMDGVECVRRLKPGLPDTEFMMLTVFEDHELVFASLEAGATGYLVKKTRPEELLQAIRDLHGGGSPMSSSIARKVVLAFARQRAPQDPLSVREREVLEKLSTGMRYKEIANHFKLSEHTVRTHLHNIYKKLQVGTKAEAIHAHRNRR